MKQYNGEKAIISLTSWKARINTVSKTLFSLIKQCPGFHIVLVLSEEEFPQKEKELPEDLMLFVNNNLIELLWVYKNYKSLKKILFTMDKYRTVPIISADDDCIYTCNYAEILYNTWLTNKDHLIVTNNTSKFRSTTCQNGPCTLFPPYYYKNLGIKLLTDVIIDRNQDDVYYAVLRDILKLTKYKRVKYSMKDMLYFHTNCKALNLIYGKKNYNNDTIDIYYKEISKQL